MSWRIIEDDVLAGLALLEDRSVQTCVTSPPYYGLRDYGTAEWEGGTPECDHAGTPLASDKSGLAGYTSDDVKVRTYTMPQGQTCGKCGARRIDNQIGLEASPDEYVARLVGAFREVRRVLRDDGTLWLNLGDSYAGSGPSGASYESATTKRRREQGSQDGAFRVSPTLRDRGMTYADKKPIPPAGYKPKDLLGIPWMVAFALRADGWYLRSDIIWAKPNPMPESVTDRPTKVHEYLFLLSKSRSYFYDADAIREEHGSDWLATRKPYDLKAWNADRGDGGQPPQSANEAGRNKRSVWTIPTQPFPGAHFAVFPPKLIEPCILAGSSSQACADCGAPWRRVVERTPAIVRPSERRALMAEQQGGLARTNPAGTMEQAPSSKTLGWESSCEHDDGSGRSVILDPFSGAGTTGVVSRWNRRSFVGVELNPEYAAMARQRIETEGRLGYRPSTQEAEQIPGQLGLL